MTAVLDHTLLEGLWVELELLLSFWKVDSELEVCVCEFL